MPGLYGIFSNHLSDKHILRSRFESMQKALNYRNYKVESFEGDFALLGTIGPGKRAEIVYFSYAGNDYVAGIDGSIDSICGSKDKLDLGVIYKKIVAAKLANNCMFFASLNGEYNIFIFCLNSQSLFLVTDRFSLKKLYRVIDKDAIYFFPDFSALTALSDVATGNNDLPAIADHFLYTHPLNENTFKENVKLLPSASVITIDKALQITVQRYWDPSCGGTCSFSNFEECVDDGYHLLEQAVARKINGSNKITVSLSGGLDSRILAALAAPQVDLVATTYGYKKSYDCTIAKQVADVLGVEWRHENIDANYVEQVEDIAIRLNDGMAPAEQFFHINAINRISEGNNRYCTSNLSGFYGDLLLGGSKKPASLECYDTIVNDVVGWIEGSLSHNLDCEQYRYIFTDKFNKLISLRRKEYLSEIADLVGGSDLGERGDLQIDNIFVMYHARRYLSSLCQYTLYGRDLKPFFDYDFFDYYLTIPFEYRVNHRLYFSILKKFLPEMADIPYASTGKNVGEASSFFFKKKKQIYNSANYRLSRLTRGKLLLNDPNNYVQLAKWHFASSSFIEKAKNILLEEQTLDRKILNSSGVKQLYADFKKGKWEGGIILNLYFLEKWFRVYLDGEKFNSI